jgi:hypothetical protein
MLSPALRPVHGVAACGGKGFEGQPLGTTLQADAKQKRWSESEGCGDEGGDQGPDTQRV